MEHMILRKMHNATATGMIMNIHTAQSMKQNNLFYGATEEMKLLIKQSDMQGLNIIVHVVHVMSNCLGTRGSKICIIITLGDPPHLRIL